MFRAPFVFACSPHIEAVVPPLSLFKVFPRLGATILGHPTEQASMKIDHATAHSEKGAMGELDGSGPAQADAYRSEQDGPP